MPFPAAWLELSQREASMSDYLSYDPHNWYWLVNGKTYGSARNAYLETEDAAFTAFLNDGGFPTTIGSEDELIEVLLPYGIIPPFCSPEKQRAWAIKQLNPAMRILFEEHR